MDDVFIVRPTPTQPGSLNSWLRSARSSAPIPNNRLLRSLSQFSNLLHDVVVGRSLMNSRDLCLRLRPISKARPRSFRGQSRPYTDTVYKNWLKDAKTLLEEWWIWPPLEHVHLMEVEFHGAARGDLDNRLGSVLDAMVQANVITDDNVNVIPNVRMSFVKAKTVDARINIKLTWEAQ